MDSFFTQSTDLELLSEIKDKSVDLVLTDPPYIISKASGMDGYRKYLDAGGEHVLHPDGSKNNLALTTDFGEWDNSYTIDDLGKAINQFYRILRPGGSCIIFFDIWKIETLANLLSKFSKHRFIEWVKTNPVPINQRATYLSNAREIAISCVKGGKATFNSKYDNGIYDKYPIYHGKDRFHPTQKSLLLFEDLIKKHSNEGDVVVDPYVGSGTTALAAKNTNRIYICGEPSDDYFQKGYDRVHKTIDI
jgi:site-specific DNA-methyltransferase (adenine-specific)